MQSNIDNYFVDHDFPDSWVELQNITDEDIDLYDFRIGGKDNADCAYRIPEHYVLRSHGFIVICCDKKNTGLHTDFRLESDSEGDLYLFDAGGYLLDKLSYPAMPTANIAYGRSLESEELWGWELTPTPGIQNDGSFSDFVLPDPVFNIVGCRLDSKITVKITMPEGDMPEDTRIYITTDGKEPTLESKSGTQHSISVSKTTVIRAKLISSSAHSRRSMTQSYIFHPRDTKLPILSIVTDKAYLYSDSEGILSSAETDGIPNYEYDWRRPINVEYLLAGRDTAIFNQYCETAVGSSSTRNYPQKPLKLYANKRFEKKKFKGNFWAEKPDVKKVKSFTIRTGGDNCDRGRINDAFAQRLFGIHVPNLDYMAYAPVIAYINGVYKGVFGLRERSNEDYVEANYGIKDVEMASHESYFHDSKEWSQNSFEQVYDLYQNDSTTYSQLAEIIDVDNFMKVMIAEIYAENWDYPENNVSMWREKTPEGKWKWILKDLDYFAYITSANFNMFKFLLGEPAPNDYEYDYVTDDIRESRKLYQKMMSFPEFQNAFIDHFAIYLGDFLKPAYALNMLEQMKKEIYNEINPTFTANDNMSKLTRFNQRVDSIKLHCRKRPAILYRQMAKFFSLGSVVAMSLRPNEDTVYMNNVRLTEGNFAGAYFSNRALNLNSGKSNVGWKMKIYTKNSSNKRVLSDSISFDSQHLSLWLKDYNKCDSVAIATYKFAEPEQDLRLEELIFEEASDNEARHSIMYYNCMGMPLRQKTKGLVITHERGAKTSRIMLK